MLFALARTRVGAVCVHLGITYLSRWLPITRVYDSDTVVAFCHPRQAYPVHVLIVPKRGAAGIEAIGPADGPLIAGVVAAAQQVAQTLGIDRGGYRLVVNGGAYQDVRRLHFHLISEADPVDATKD